jgi:putative nucleotidyltransferase-like protein
VHGVSEHPFDDIEATMKKAVAAFREANVPALLAGSLAVWARGGPEPRHDLDFVVKPEDAERALQALESVGMKSERPPEAWLYKAWDGEVLVDVIFEPRGLVVDDEMMARAEEREVMAIGIRLMALEDVLVSKLMSLDEHSADYSQLLLMARSLRERIDWDDLRARTSASPFAKAFFTLVEELGIGPRAGAGTAAEGTPARARVRVVEGG